MNVFDVLKKIGRNITGLIGQFQIVSFKVSLLYLNLSCLGMRKRDNPIVSSSTPRDLFPDIFLQKKIIFFLTLMTIVITINDIRHQIVNNEEIK